MILTVDIELIKDAFFIL